MSHPIKLVLSFVAFSFSSLAVAVPVTFSVGGDDTAASIQATVDSFRAALGSPNNGNAPGPLAGGRREINWDGGGGVDVTTAATTPFNVFRDTRGAQFTTPGTGLSQAPPSGGPTNGLVGLFANPTYGTTFSTFSPLRLFVPVGSNITDGLFFLPGSNGAVPATISGFGAVFTDVDLANTTTIAYFNAVTTSCTARRCQRARSPMGASRSSGWCSMPGSASLACGSRPVTRRWVPATAAG
jgi:hypothetical protein